MAFAKEYMYKVILSLVLLVLLIISFQEYRIGLLENKANKLFPKLVSAELDASSLVLEQVVDSLGTEHQFASQRHWQRGLIYEWQEDRDKLILALSEIQLAIERRPGWPLMWRDLLRINIKLGAPVEARVALLERFQRVGEWNRQSVIGVSHYMLLIWERLSNRERNWLIHRASIVAGESAWLDLTRELIILKIVPTEVCVATWRTNERIHACKASEIVK